MRSLFLILFFSVHFTQALAQLDTLLIPNIPNLTSNDLRRKTDMIVRSGDDIWIGLLQKEYPPSKRELVKNICR